ncbi:MAG: hypothetical protein IJ481_00725 [Alphaproteobacteria bacterium]|nr:hypothetical protein [Alphaproteobacteria bacterium]
MKHIKLVMLEVLTSSLYASGFYGGFDIGPSCFNTKTHTDLSAYRNSFVQGVIAPGDYHVNRNITKTKLTTRLFAGHKFNSKANGGG